MDNLGIVTITGDFTLLKYIAMLSGEDLERTVGFHRGRLRSGFRIVALAADEVLLPADFSLKASTRWTQGLVRDPDSAEKGRAIGRILSDRGTDSVALNAKVAGFFARRGGATPAKVLPNLLHDAGMNYPDAEALRPGFRSGVPQFHLITPRRFVVVRHQLASPERRR